MNGQLEAKLSPRHLSAKCSRHYSFGVAGIEELKQAGQLYSDLADPYWLLFTFSSLAILSMSSLSSVMVPVIVTFSPMNLETFFGSLMA